jgi:hypothetical protein
MAKGKWQMENHLKFAICLLPFDLLVSLHEPAARGWGLGKTLPACHSEEFSWAFGPPN